MLNRELDKPLFIQLKEKIEENIKEREPNEKIPSEPELAKRFNVSRGTVNKAIKRLTSEGKLYRIPKKGTYVSARKIQRNFKKLPSYSEDIKQRGLQPGALLVELSKVIPEEKIRDNLNLNEDSVVWKIKRIRTADEERVLLSTSYLPVSIFPEITRDEVLGSLYKTLETKYNNRPHWAHETYTAINADQITASLLNIDAGAALIYSERLSYSKDERPIEFAVSYIRGDSYEIHIDINRKTENKNNWGKEK